MLKINVIVAFKLDWLAISVFDIEELHEKLKTSKLTIMVRKVKIPFENPYSIILARHETEQNCVFIFKIS